MEKRIQEASGRLPFHSVRSSNDRALVAFGAAVLLAFAAHAGALLPELARAGASAPPAPAAGASGADMIAREVAPPSPCPRG